MEKVKIELTFEQFNTIQDALARAPYAQVVGVINALAEQVRDQVAADKLITPNAPPPKVEGKRKHLRNGA